MSGNQISKRLVEASSGQMEWPEFLNIQHGRQPRVLDIAPTIAAPVITSAGPQTNEVLWTYKLPNGIVNENGEGIYLEFFLACNTVGAKAIQVLFEEVAKGAGAPSSPYTNKLETVVTDIGTELQMVHIVSQVMYANSSLGSGSGISQKMFPSSASQLFPFPVDATTLVLSTLPTASGLSMNPTDNSGLGVVPQDVYFEVVATIAASGSVELLRAKVEYRPSPILKTNQADDVLVFSGTEIIV